MYLGVTIDESASAHTELNERLKQAAGVWRKFDIVWKIGKCSKKTKIRFFNAVVQSKLVYGLDTIAITRAQKTKIDAFQARGIRRILQMKATYIERKNTNTKVLQIGYAVLNSRNKNKKESIVKITKTLKFRRI